MGFIYKDLISIWRPEKKTAVGDRGYGAQRGASTETKIFDAVSASIQGDRGTAQRTGLPTDSREQGKHVIYIRRSVCRQKGIAQGSIVSTDIIIDQAGFRYAVGTPNWTSLGMQLRCILLEV